MRLLEGKHAVIYGGGGSGVGGRLVERVEHGGHHARTLEDAGNVAAFATPDWARTMTGTALNITCGTEIA